MEAIKKMPGLEVTTHKPGNTACKKRNKYIVLKAPKKVNGITIPTDDKVIVMIDYFDDDIIVVADVINHWDRTIEFVNIYAYKCVDGDREEDPDVYEIYYDCSVPYCVERIEFESLPLRIKSKAIRRIYEESYDGKC